MLAIEFLELKYIKLEFYQLDLFKHLTSLLSKLPKIRLLVKKFCIISGVAQVTLEVALSQIEILKLRS